MIKLIATDMDGTLLDDNHEINPEFWDIFNQLKKQKVTFACASGRQYYNLIKKFNSIKDDIYFIAENGSYLAHKGKVLYSNNLEWNKTLEFIEIARNIEGVNIVLCCEKSAYIESDNKKFIEEVKPYYEKFENIDKFENVKDKVLKIALCDFKNSETNSYHYFKKFESDYKITVSGGVWLDISNFNANKGIAITMVQDILGITPKETLVFGDYLNDIELIKSATHSYAMKNAHPQLKKLANYTAKSNNENGVVEKIKELLNL